MQKARARKARGEPAPGIISFRRGLQTLPDTLAARLPAGSLSLKARVERLVPQARWRWQSSQKTRLCRHRPAVFAAQVPEFQSRG